MIRLTPLWLLLTLLVTCYFIQISAFFLKSTLKASFPKNKIELSKSVKIHQHIQSSFDEFLDSMDAPVLVDFYAEWCGPCRMMAPVLQDIAGRFENIAKIAKIDTDKAPAVAAKYQIDALPTLVLFYKGAIIDRYIGFRDADTLERELVQSLKKIGEFH